jgi:hypothetical protein
VPAFDRCHEQVVHALEKDGWRVLREHMKLAFSKRRVFVDLQVARGDNGHRQDILLIEVKCFSDPDSYLQDIYTAIGQYITYRAILMDMDVNIPLYLSIPEGIFTSFEPAIQHAFRDHRIRIIVIDLEAEKVVQWIE